MILFTGEGSAPLHAGIHPPWADIPRHTYIHTTGYGQKRAICILLECILVTTRKQSLGQGNIFTPVCHSVHKGVVPGPRGGAWSWGGGTWSQGGSGPGGVPGGDPPGRLI